ncbi:MAG: ABC transporter permease [Vicinamibacteraceae bacterium]
MIAHLNPIRFARHLWRQRHLIAQLTGREVQSRYRGSALGLLWSLLTPLFLLVVYAFVFGTVFKARWPQGDDANLRTLSLILFAGLIVFGLFSECVARAGTLVVSVPNYVKKVVFPIEVLPVVLVGAALFQASINVGILTVANWLITGRVPPTVLLTPVAAVPLVCLTLGITWVLASLGVFLRDVAQAVGLMLQALFFLTPIFYPLEAAPPAFRQLLFLNPLTANVEAFRAVLLWGHAPDWRTFGVSLAVSVTVMLLGYAAFMRSKRGFADVL